MIYEIKPQDFHPKVEVVGCIVEYKGKVLMLLPQDHKPYKNLWGSPAGKIERGEDIHEAMLRELKEETTIKIEKKDITFIKKYYLKYPDIDFVYYLFYTKLNEEPKVKITEREHKEFKWLTPKESLKLDLIPDEDFCIKYVYKIK